MIRIVDCHAEDPFAHLASRGVNRDSETADIVAGIIQDVRSRGDQALLENARKFDSPHISHIGVSPDEITEAEIAELPLLEQAARRVHDFHKHQLDTLMAGFQAGGWWSSGPPENTPFTSPGVGQRLLPLKSVGVYVPGGRATYPSSVLMNAIPAVVSGVSHVVVTTPCRSDGTLAPSVLAAMRLAGVSQGFKIGGAAAVAALAYGTETVPRVDKIVGPGNCFVNEAKRQVWGEVGLDGYAGPSEVCVVVDDEANAAYAASDLLTQIEHAPDNCAFLVALSRRKLDEVLAEVRKQVDAAPRKAIFAEALQGDSTAFVARDAAQAADIVNAIAPEHLSLSVADPEAWLPKIQNAGCVLMGEFSPESAGDFAAGPSHTLPTSGAARFGSPVNVLDFLKVQSVIHLSRSDLKHLLPVIETLGQLEGLPAHANGAKIRFEENP